MFTLTLCYPEGVQEDVRSAFIPPVGMLIHGDTHYGTFRVTAVRASVGGSVLSDHLYIELEDE